jgi:hypothetical protein
MRFILTSLVLMSVVAVQGVAFQADSPQATVELPQAVNLVGRWRVKFNLSGVGEKNLVLDSRGQGSGSFLLLDAGPNDKSGPTLLPAAWSETTNDRVNFSGEVELPIGTCCREIGTLVFKGKFASKNSIAGKVIFIMSTTDEENFNGFRSSLGTFTATRVLDNARSDVVGKEAKLSATIVIDLPLSDLSRLYHVTRNHLDRSMTLC